MTDSNDTITISTIDGSTIPAFNTGKVTTMASMFNACFSLITIPTLTTTNVSNMNSMFSSANSLQYVPNYSYAICTSIGSMFNGCSSLQYIPNMTTTTALANAYSAFQGCSSLLAAPTISVTTNIANTISMFANCKSLTTIAVFDKYDKQLVLDTCNELDKYFISKKIKVGVFEYYSEANPKYDGL